MVLYFRDLKDKCIYNRAPVARVSLLDPRHGEDPVSGVTGREIVMAR